MSKILVVDDEAINRELLQDFLEEKGYDIITASGGKEALVKIKENPDLVLLDIMMPDMNGLQVLEKIKEMAPSMQVIMVTSLAEKEIAVASLKKGATHYITKPVNLNNLEDVLRMKMAQIPTAKQSPPKSKSLPSTGAPLGSGKEPQKKEPGKALGSNKRTCRRFEIPGAEGRYKKTGLQVVVKGFSKPFPVANVSKGGLAFMTKEKLKKGQKITIQLVAPNEPPLNLRSLIRRVEWSVANKASMVGVEFMPFGNRAGGNTTDALNILRRLDEQYG